ncbi:GH32 C-terminal domain-containing protein [Microbacterium rhizosphaerae]|uniref:GH32 C-terminal domain-containing protein n=1 Tax=Microbacterium rhizosphaerae TaxID=1678237 RepID=A0ABZ0SKN4_9MICO|nr:GH32 C-terminal domain-containing protein [Microbacterium rhizosphaerae]WPR89454.1 GH32 C-terminal domain-containing protein [Microbacterium rhizosphaerae]
MGSTVPRPSRRARRNAVAGAAIAAMASALLAFTAPAHASTATPPPAPHTETYRPQFHFTPQHNWMNDPNGLVYYKGEYHLFFQYNPTGNTWGNMSWGHAVSKDLVHWTELPVAIPQDTEEMVFSGSAVVDTNDTSGFGTPGNPAIVAIYTSLDKATGQQKQSLAYSTDDGRTFIKYAGNPVLDIGSFNFRDPKVFWYAAGNEWLMAAALSDQHKVTFYSSADLKHWTHLSDFGPANATGGAWECPDLFPIADPQNPGKQKWVLVVNVNPGSIAGGSGTQYFTGDFDGTTFTADDTPYVPPTGTSLGDFDGATWDAGWTTSGAAFGTGPTPGNAPGQGGVTGYIGAGLANSYNGFDGATGSLTSSNFTIDQPYLNFLVGGGNHPYVPGSVVGNALPAGTTFADFEGPTYGTGWTTTGDFVGTGPAPGTWPGQNQVSGYVGNQLVNTFINGDQSEGSITSPAFTISSNYINLLVGGGRHPWGVSDPTSVNLVVDGKVVASATGRNDEALDWADWDVSAYTGKSATIQIVDQNSGGWGHINVDQIMFSPQPSAPRAVDTSVRLIVDGNVVRTATGPNSESLDWNSWNLSDLQGKTAHIEVVDNNTGGWGHILADQFSLAGVAAQSVIQRAHWIDFGKDDYAAVTYNDAPGGKRIMIGWMNNWDYGGSIPTSPWRSAMTIPRELSLEDVDGQDVLVQKPVTQLDQLKTAPSSHVQNLSLPNRTATLDARGDTADIDAVLAPGTATTFGLNVRVGNGQQTSIGYDTTTGEVYVDRTKSGDVSFDPSFAADTQRAPLKLQDGKLKLHILVDWSSVEVFANDGKVLITDQIFPDPASTGINAFATGGTASLVSLTVHQMSSTWTRSGDAR